MPVPSLSLLLFLSFSIVLSHASRDYFVAASKYITAAPDSVGKCTYSPPTTWNCNEQWLYHPVGQTGNMVILNNTLYVASTPATYISINTIAKVNVSSAKVLGYNQDFGFIMNLLAWPAANSILVLDGLTSTYNKSYGTQALWKWQPSTGTKQKILDYSVLAPAVNNTYSPFCYLGRAALISGGNTLVANIYCVGGQSRLFMADTETGKFSVGHAFGVQYLNTLAGDITGSYIFSTDQTWVGYFTFSLVVKSIDEFLNGLTGKTVIADLNTLCGFPNNGFNGRSYWVEDMHYDGQEDMVLLGVSMSVSSKPFDRWHYLYSIAGVTTDPTNAKCYLVTSFQGSYDLVAPVSVAFSQ